MATTRTARVAEAFLKNVPQAGNERLINYSQQIEAVEKALQDHDPEFNKDDFEAVLDGGDY